jgi:hypothetical protein
MYTLQKYFLLLIFLFSALGCFALEINEPKNLSTKNSEQKFISELDFNIIYIVNEKTETQEENNNHLEYNFLPPNFKFNQKFSFYPQRNQNYHSLHELKVSLFLMFCQFKFHI